MKKLSVIVPCYNVEQYIDRCMESLVNQTLDKSEYEIILVDDASEDSTWEHIESWEKQYPELVIAVHCDENGKMGRARNIGLSYSSGEYIGYVDSDDWVEPEMFKTMSDIAVKNNQDIVVCNSIRDRESDFVKDTEETGIRVNCVNINSDGLRKDFIVNMPMQYSVWNKLIRRSLMIDNNIYFPENVAYEDVFFGTLLHLYAERVAYVDVTFYHYYVNPHSTVLQKNADYHKDIMTSNIMLLEELKRRGAWEHFHDELELDMLFTWYLGTVKVICLRYDNPPYDMFCKLKRDVLELMPGCTDNPYIGGCMKEFYQLLVQLLACDVSREDLNIVAQNFKKV